MLPCNEWFSLHFKGVGAGHSIGFIFWVDSPGSWVKEDFENGQDRGRMIIKESVVTVQNETLKPRKQQKWEGRWGAGDCLLSG